MAEMTFLNFDLVIRHTAGDQYRAEANIPGWQVARVDFEQPFSDEEVGSFRDAGGPARDLEAPQGQLTRVAGRIQGKGRRLWPASVRRGDRG